jgi:hypothetical protein
MASGTPTIRQRHYNYRHRQWLAHNDKKPSSTTVCAQCLEEATNAKDD